jgi:quercetin dioxygenase-like cupin family protein
MVNGRSAEKLSQKGPRDLTMNAAEFVLLKPDETRLGKTLNIIGDQVLVKLSGQDTAGQFAVMFGVTPPKAGPPLHRHSREDEAFCVLEGEFLFEVDGKQFHAGPGTFAFLPRGTAHTFQNVTDKPGKLLILVQPAGAENFFVEIDAAMRGMSEPEMSLLAPIFQEFGMELLGPPIGARTAGGEHDQASGKRATP